MLAAVLQRQLAAWTVLEAGCVPAHVVARASRRAHDALCSPSAAPSLRDEVAIVVAHVNATPTGRNTVWLDTRWWSRWRAASFAADVPPLPLEVDGTTDVCVPQCVRWPPPARPACACS